MPDLGTRSRDPRSLIDHFQYYLVDEGRGLTITASTHPEPPTEQRRQIAGILQSFRPE